MKLTDILAFAKAGYSPADVREFMKAEDPKVEPEKKEDPKVEPEKKEDPKVEPEKKEDPKVEPEKKEDPKAGNTDPDYKALYEKSQADLKAAQSANNNTNHQGEIKSDADIVNSWLSSFME